LTGPRIARHARRDGGQDRAAAGHQRGRLSCGMLSADRRRGLRSGCGAPVLRGEKAAPIDQCCNRESLAERGVGLCGQLRVWHRIARSEEILNHPYVTGSS